MQSLRLITYILLPCFALLFIFNGNNINYYNGNAVNSFSKIDLVDDHHPENESEKDIVGSSDFVDEDPPVYLPVPHYFAHYGSVQNSAVVFPISSECCPLAPALYYFSPPPNA